jgi:hypothetical protein
VALESLRSPGTDPLDARRALSKGLSLLDVAQLAVPAFLLLVLTYTIADADLWGHLTFGTDLLRGHGFTLHDPYSFTSDTPWINHEWLAEVCVAAFYALGGAFGLNILKLGVISGLAALVWRAGREEGGQRFALVMLTGLVVFASYTRTQVLRPQLFSVLLFATLMTVLRHRERCDRGWRITIPALFCVWANTHGAWIVGFGALTAWSAGMVASQRTVACTRRRAIDVLSALAASLINPYGIGLWTFLHETVGLERDISDWTPFIKFPASLIAIELALPAVAIVALARRRQIPPTRHLAVIAILAFGTYRVGRVDAFLQVAIGMLLAPTLIGLFQDLESWLRTHHRLTNRSRPHAMAAAALAAYVAVVGVRHVGTIHIDGTWIPDAEAMKFLQQDAAHTRVLTWFDWGEYAIWHLAPSGTQVSMDGRRETVYSPRVLQDHWAFYKNEKDAWSYPEAIGAQRIWLPKTFPVVPVLRERGWHVAFESDISIVLTPNDTRPTTASQIARGPRVFPGP